VFVVIKEIFENLYFTR